MLGMLISALETNAVLGLSAGIAIAVVAACGAVSMMLAIGRFGGIAGSFLVAGLIQWNLSIEEIFFILAIPALIAALCLYLKYWLYKDQNS